MELSLLAKDTKKSDVLPESLGLPLRPAEEQQEEYAARMKRQAALMEAQKVGRPARVLACVKECAGVTPCVLGCPCVS